MSTFSKKYEQWKEWVRNLPRRTKIIVIVIAVFFLILGVAALLLFIANQKIIDEEAGVTSSMKAHRDAKVKQAMREGAVRDSAKDAIDDGDVSRVDTVYRAAINAETDPAKKIRLYLDQSEVLYDAGKYDEAIDVAKEAEGISDDKYKVAFWLARVLEDRKQYKSAADYYKLAGEWATSPTNEERLNKAYFDSQAKRVLALADNQ